MSISGIFLIIVNPITCAYPIFLSAGNILNTCLVQWMIDRWVAFTGH